MCLHKGVELPGTSGILRHWFEVQKAGMRLAYIGCLKDDILNIEVLSLSLISYLPEFYPATLNVRCSVGLGQKPSAILTAVARARRCMKQGEEFDYENASRSLLGLFRSG